MNASNDPDVTGSHVPVLTLLLALLAWTSPALAREKTDVVYLRNGDRVTCEIKRLERGRLEVSTNDMGTVYIEWDDIERVTSQERYIVELEDGTRFEGTLAATDAQARLLLRKEGAVDADGNVQGNGQEKLLDMEDVVWLDPLKLDPKRINRWDGSVSAGFDATKANSDRSLSASFDARRRAEDFQLLFDASVYSRSQDGTDDSLRANFNGVYRGLLEDRWYWAGLGGLERNDELGIDLRSFGGAGYGRFLVQSNRTLWSVTGGLVVVNEQLAGESKGETNLDAFLNTDFEFFTYDTPKTTLNTSFTVFPRLTGDGGVRLNLDFSLRRELIEDLFLELSLYETYNSNPPADGNSNDWGLVTSLGYTF
jgi:putative salt-induced outer membrane protein YdiY/small nuclear ribonucleoprotein (snRNP)-like protein